MDKKKILILETNEEIIETYKKALDEDFSVLVSKTNKDARFKTDNDEFGLIIAELKLVDGLAVDTVKKFREFGRNKETPVLLISDIGDQVLEQFSKIKGFSFLKKPTTADALKAKAKEFVSLPKKGVFIDVKFINPVIMGTIKTLETMTGVLPEAGKPYVKQKSEISGDISGIIGITSSTYEGSIALSFTKKLFLAVVSKMLGEECKVIDEGTKDAVAELVNIIFGQAKKTLSDEGYLFDKSLPSIITGEAHTIDYQSNLPVMVIPFKTSLGDFRVEVCASEKKKK
jgi:chemotaxis protein CheX